MAHHLSLRDLTERKRTSNLIPKTLAPPISHLSWSYSFTPRANVCRSWANSDPICETKDSHLRATWRAQNQLFDNLAAVNGANYNITGQAKPERILGARVSLVLTEPGLVVVGSTTVPARVIAYFFACGTWTFPPLMVSGSNVRSVTSAPVGLVTFNPNRS